MPPTNLALKAGALYVLKGRIVTMDQPGTVLSDGMVCVNGTLIQNVISPPDPLPSAFQHAPVIDTQGTIYPGLIELHNHLSYNALPLWGVPKEYTNRDAWRKPPDYPRNVTQPMCVLGKIPEYLEAIVRYVECKCLLAGVTTSQGIALSSNAGARRYYHGIIRNIEQPDDKEFKAARTHIADVAATDVEKFNKTLQRSNSLLLHLSEGKDTKTHDDFLALRRQNGDWAITSALAGIHCVALQPTDYDVMQAHGASVVWSPLSNLLLYGQTADVREAKSRGIRIGLGADWSPSGSKNLLGELKVARIVNSKLWNNTFTDRELVAMATCDAARIVKWDALVGSLEAGKRADLLVVDGNGGDPYAHLIEAKETAIQLVVIDGVPRYGTPPLMSNFHDIVESWHIGQQHAARSLFLQPIIPDPRVDAITLAEAQSRLSNAMSHLPEIAQGAHPFAAMATPRKGKRWSLALDLDDPPDRVQRVYFRPHPPAMTASPGEKDSAAEEARRAAVAALQAARSEPEGGPVFGLSPSGCHIDLIQPLTLDPLTVADDPEFLTNIAAERNLPDFIKHGLPKLY